MTTLQRLITLIITVVTLLPALPVQGQTCRLYLDDARPEQLGIYIRQGYSNRLPENWRELFHAHEHDEHPNEQIFERIDNRPFEPENSREAALWRQCTRLPPGAVRTMQGVTYEGDPVCAVKLSEEAERLLIAPGARGPMMSVHANSSDWAVEIAQPSKLPDGTDGYALTLPRAHRFGHRFGGLSSSSRYEATLSSGFFCSVPEFLAKNNAAGGSALAFEADLSFGNICECPRGFLDFLNDSRKASWFSVTSSTEDLSGVCGGEGCLTAYQGISELEFASHDSREGFYVDSIQFTQRPSLGLWFPSTSNLHKPFSGCFSQELKYSPLNSRITFSNDDKKALLNEAEYYYTLSQLVTAKKALSKHINSTIIATQLTESDIFDPFEHAESYEMVDSAYQLWLASRPTPTEDQSAALSQLNSTFVALMQSIELNSAIKDLQEIIFEFSSFRRTPTPAVFAWGRYMNKTFPEGAVEPVDWYEALFLGICPAPYKCGGAIGDAQIALARAITDKQAIVAKHFNSLPWIAQIQRDSRFKAGALIPRSEVKYLSLNYLKRYLNTAYPDDKRLLDDYEALEAHLKCPSSPEPRLSQPLQELVLNLPPRLPLTETILPESEAARMTTLCQQGDVNACAQRDYLKKRYAVERVFESIRFRRNTLTIKDQVNKSIEATGRVAALALVGNYLGAGMAMVAPRAISAVVEGTGLARGLSNAAAVGRTLGWTAEKNVMLLKSLALAGYGSSLAGAANAVYQSVSECDELAKSVTNDDNQSLKEYFSCVEAKQTEVANILMPAIGLKRLSAGLCGGARVVARSRLKNGSKLTAKAGRGSGACGLVTASPDAAVQIARGEAHLMRDGERLRFPWLEPLMARGMWTNARLFFAKQEKTQLMERVERGLFNLPISINQAKEALRRRMPDWNGQFYWDSAGPADQLCAKIARNYINQGLFDGDYRSTKVAAFLKRRLQDLVGSKVIPDVNVASAIIGKAELQSPLRTLDFPSIYVQQWLTIKIRQQVTDVTGTRTVEYTYKLRWHTKDPGAVIKTANEAYYKIERSYQKRDGTWVNETFRPDPNGAVGQGTWRGDWMDDANGRAIDETHIRAELADLDL